MSGLKASVDLDSADVTLIYTVPAGVALGTYTVSICPRDIKPKVSLALTSGGVPGTGSWIEFNTEVVGTPLERTGIALAAGHKIYAQTDIANVSVGVWGIEEEAA